MAESHPTPSFGKSPAAATRGAGGAARQAKSRPAGFWHRPELMNLVSDVLMLVASVALGYAAVKAAMRAPWFGLNQVVVTSPLSQVTPAQLEYAAASSLRGNFFTVDLDAARQAFEKLPWVRHAQLRRVWPATVEVSLEEHVAAAYWRGVDSSDVQLINTNGEVFDAASNATMPTFSGSPENARLMLDRDRQFDAKLKPLGRRVDALTLSNRMAWQLKLDNGLTIELGRDQQQAPIDTRLDRFLAIYGQAENRLGSKILVADLRYPGGFAVKLEPTARSAEKTGKR
ncbi:MAG: cell division protein FtsQ/DivIB [Rhodocyclaceae bacterium]